MNFKIKNARSFVTIMVVIVGFSTFATTPLYAQEEQDIETVIETVSEFTPLKTEIPDSVIKSMNAAIRTSPKVNLKTNPNSATDYASIQEKYAQDDDFNYEEAESRNEGLLKRIIRKIEKFIDKLFGPLIKINSNLSELLLYFFILLGVVALIYCFVLFFRKNGGITKADLEKEMQQDAYYLEKNLMEVDIHQLLNEAVKNQQYNAAIRYQYLINLQQLVLNQYFKWNYTYTSADIAQLIQVPEVKASFISMSDVYNRIWFGNKIIDEAAFQVLQTEFKSFTSLLTPQS